MKRKIAIELMLVGMVLTLASAIGVAQVSASSSASSEGPARATVGTFLFEEGSKIAFELHRSDPCPCMCEPILVEGLQVLDRANNPIYTKTWDPVLYEKWTGTWDLKDNRGKPVSPGTYTIVIRTSIGEFIAKVEIVSRGELPLYGRMSVQASVCGFGLDVYRLITKDDVGSIVEMRTGERIMIALPGNPTTGYRWDLLTELSDGILDPLHGIDYRPDSSLIGAGGTFMFRYAAEKSGTIALKFVYHRPWDKTSPPQESFVVTVVVR